MLLQKFLRDNGPDGLKLLEERYGVTTKRHNQYPNLVLAKYSQILSPMGDPLVQECRGVILDESNDWSVISRSYNKFFNHSEGHAANIDWSTARVQEKLDGSLMQLYYYDGTWRVASSGTPDACGQVNGFDFTFADLFWKVFDEMGYKLPDEDCIVDVVGMAREYCYMFELMTPYNRVVVQHHESWLVLIGVRHQDGHEVSVEAWADDYQVVRSFPLYSIDEIIATFPSMSPLSQEGYVVVDGSFNRVKVKSPAYLSLHHMKDSMSPRRALEVVRAGEISEILSAFPEWKDIFEEIKTKYDDLVWRLEHLYGQIRDITVQKDFALAIKHYSCSGALFSLRAGKVKSVREYLAAMNIDSLADALKVETQHNFNKLDWSKE